MQECPAGDGAITLEIRSSVHQDRVAAARGRIFGGLSFGSAAWEWAVGRQWKSRGLAYHRIMAHAGRRWTRRGFLATGLAAAGAASQGRKPPEFPAFPSDARRYSDPSTGLDVIRLTDPAYSSTLPAYYGRAIASNGGYLLLACGRTGSPQVFRLDLKNGGTEQLTEAEGLDGATVTLTPDNRGFCYCAGRSLFLARFGANERELYRVPEGWERGRGMTVGPDGGDATLIETRGGGSRLRTLPLGAGAPRTVIEAAGTMADPLPRPHRGQTLYHSGGRGLWLVNRDGRENRMLALAAGRTAAAVWAPDGRTLTYLLYPEDPEQLHTIREHTPETGADRLIAKTSQFASFSANHDASVFAGASENKGSPHVLLLLRATGSERTLCEHRASDAAAVCPVFSPDSQRLYFQSDRDGKAAIYSVQLDQLVEKTGTERVKK
jgi:oligogalacturonide lyase